MPKIIIYQDREKVNIIGDQKQKLRFCMICDMIVIQIPKPKKWLLRGTCRKNCHSQRFPEASREKSLFFGEWEKVNISCDRKQKTTFCKIFFIKSTCLHNTKVSILSTKYWKNHHFQNAPRDFPRQPWSTPKIPWSSSRRPLIDPRRPDAPKQPPRHPQVYVYVYIYIYIYI